MLMSFQENLKYYREKAGYKQAKDFAKVLDIPYSTYIGYEVRNREPKYQTLCKIADLLNVSTDELLGAKEKKYITKDLERLAIRNRIMLEVEKQEQQWGEEKDLSPFQWISLIGEEFGETVQAVNDVYFNISEKRKTEDIKTEAYQTIALLFRFIEFLTEQKNKEKIY